MNIMRKKILDLPGVYSTAALNLDGKLYFAVASENRGEKAYIIDADSLEYSLLWDDEDSGVMNVIQIPGENRLLCITKFYPVFQSKKAEICLLEPTEKGFLSPWKKTRVLALPYCHRIGVFQNGKGKYLVSCTLCKDKNYEQDWSMPGAVYFSELDDWKPTVQLEGLTKNHGLWIDGTDVYVTAENGVFRFDCSSYDGHSRLSPVQLSDTPTSDISVSESYYATIEPFHGNLSALYDKNYCKIGEDAMDFGHVVWTGRINGRECVIEGNRGGRKTLVLKDILSGEETVLEENVGPTQVTVVEKGTSAIVLAANHGAGIVCIYELEG